ncbi:MAG: thiamine phosphate synthase [Bacillota bacterium]|nr:thiamine phosphate synthase [Bacillota bacterium]MDP4154395.1 thiamine phosphate synthase [Bacillota bacterium]
MLILVTNRKLCKDDFLQRIQQLVKSKPHAIMLREKDLDGGEFEDLAENVKGICDVAQVPLIINQNISAAAKLKLLNIHLSISDLRKYQNDLLPFLNIGASVHSVSEAAEAQKLGASYLIAGHIFNTDCKKGVPPRGLPFLKEICESVSIPVFAIGGITNNRVKDVLETGAKGVCIMSEAMTCQNPSELSEQYRLE